MTLEKVVAEYSNSDPNIVNGLINQTNLKSGTFSTKDSIFNKRTGTLDSERGELKSNGALIYYDIGFSAGAHMNMKRKSDCTWYTEKILNDYKICMGLLVKDNNNELVVTINYNQFKPSILFPVNFWSNILNESDIRRMLDIAFTYKSSQ